MLFLSDLKDFLNSFDVEEFMYTGTTFVAILSIAIFAIRRKRIKNSKIRKEKKLVRLIPEIVRRLNQKDLHHKHVLRELSTETGVEITVNSFNLEKGLELHVFIGEHNEIEVKFLRTDSGWIQNVNDYKSEKESKEEELVISIS